LLERFVHPLCLFPVYRRVSTDLSPLFTLSLSLSLVLCPVSFLSKPTGKTSRISSDLLVPSSEPISRWVPTVDLREVEPSFTRPSRTLKTPSVRPDFFILCCLRIIDSFVVAALTSSPLLSLQQLNSTASTGSDDVSKSEKIDSPSLLEEVSEEAWAWASEEE